MKKAIKVTLVEMMYRGTRIATLSILIATAGDLLGNCTKTYSESFVN